MSRDNTPNSVDSAAPQPVPDPNLNLGDIVALRVMLEKEIEADEKWAAQYTNGIPNGEFHVANLRRKRELLAKLTGAWEFHARPF